MQTLLTSDRMIIKWELYDWPRKSASQEPDKFIQLEIIFQVNWKLTQYSCDFEIVIDTEVHKWQYTLKDWYWWYKICSLFNSMWYSLSKSNSIYSIDSDMKEWIDRLVISNTPVISEIQSK